MGVFDGGVFDSGVFDADFDGVILPDPVLLVLTVLTIGIPIVLVPDPVALPLVTPTPLVGVIIQPTPVEMLFSIPVPVMDRIVLPTPVALVFDIPIPLMGTPQYVTPDPVTIPVFVSAPPSFAFGNSTMRPDPVVLSLAIRPPLIVGGTPITVTIPVDRKRARVYIHEPWWPFRRISEMVTAHNIDRSYERMGAGRAAFHISRHEPQLRPGMLERGNIAVIEANDMPTWVGTIVVQDGSLGSGTLEVQAQGLASILEGRNTPQDEEYKKPVGSTRIINGMIDRANARGFTGIVAPELQGLGPTIAQLQIGGQSVKNALDELHDRTNWEWYLKSQVLPSYIETTLNWAEHEGVDLSDKVHLWQGYHFAEFGYKLDLSKIMASMTAIGDFGLTLPLRNSVSRALSMPAAVDHHSARTEVASAAARLAISQLPAGLATEGVTYEIMTGTIEELARRAAKGLERPLQGTEMFSATITRSLSDWSAIRVGNYITVHGSVQDGVLLERVVRIVGFQPDEERGECVLVLEVPITR